MTVHHTKHLWISIFFPSPSSILSCSVCNLKLPDMCFPEYISLALCASFMLSVSLSWCKNHLLFFPCCQSGASLLFKLLHHLLARGQRSFLFANARCSEQSSTSSVHPSFMCTESRPDFSNYIVPQLFLAFKVKDAALVQVGFPENHFVRGPVSDINTNILLK